MYLLVWISGFYSFNNIQAICCLLFLTLYSMVKGNEIYMTVWCYKLLTISRSCVWLFPHQVFHIGFCEACERVMKAEGITKTQMFFRHIRRVLEYITVKYPGTRLIMWDDMFRDVDLEVIKGQLWQLFISHSCNTIIKVMIHYSSIWRYCYRMILINNSGDLWLETIAYLAYYMCIFI